ncbi:MAG TPA: sulfur carrier protein ThiS [Rhodocyclaceae bacterium]
MSSEGEVMVNGQAVSAAGITIRDLLLQLEMFNKRVAVECNREIVPRSAYEERRVQAGDRLEIVVAVGGG